MVSSKTNRRRRPVAKAADTKAEKQPEVESEPQEPKKPRARRQPVKIINDKGETVSNLQGPLKASDKIIAAARNRKPTPPSEPLPEDTWVSEEDSKDLVVLKYAEKVKNPISGIRAFCVLCMGGYLAEIDRCQKSKQNAEKNGGIWCPLHEFRMGKNPYHTRKK